LHAFAVAGSPVAVTALGTVLIAVGSGAGAAQDKYSLQLPNGLPFSEFRGYEDWQVVAVSQTDALLKVMVANPTMIAAYKAGIPGNGKPFPDGSKIAKIEWKPKKSTEAPFDVSIPENLQDVFLIEKDSSPSNAETPLDRDGAIEARVARLVDFADAAGAERRDDFVRAKTRPRWYGHVSVPGSAALVG
jgi:hypothetical protein